MLAISWVCAARGFTIAGSSGTPRRPYRPAALDIQSYPPWWREPATHDGPEGCQTLLTVSDLPENQRVRIAAMDVYGGTTFGMTNKRDDAHTGYIPVGRAVPGRPGATPSSQWRPACQSVGTHPGFSLAQSPSRVLMRAPRRRPVHRHMVRRRADDRPRRDDRGYSVTTFTARARRGRGDPGGRALPRWRTPTFPRPW